MSPTCPRKRTRPPTPASLAAASRAPRSSPSPASTQAAESAARILKERTGGKFTLTLGYGEIFSKARENLDSLKIGAIEMAFFCNFYHPGKNPGLMVLTMPFLPIGDAKERPAQVQIGGDDQNLYARFEVKSAVPFLNTPTDYRLLFKTGSALELCLTPHLGARAVTAGNRHPMQLGDLRVLIARTRDGRLIATRYRPKTADKEKPLAHFFETPASGREDFDEIAEWNELSMNYREIQGGYVVEMAVPWNATAIKPQPGLKFLCDAGVITGNEGGTRNAVRAMWSDRTPEVGVNNDIPTESRLHPTGCCRRAGAACCPQGRRGSPPS